MKVGKALKIGQRMKEIRLSRGIQQKFMAEKLGVNISTYCNYESGIREPDFEVIKAFSECLSVPLSDLIIIQEGE